MAAGAAALALGVGIALPAAAGPGSTDQATQRADQPSSEFHGPAQTAPAAAEAEAATPAPFALAATNLTYSTVDPCRTFDSRSEGGPFGRGQGYFLNLTGPCGLPSDGSVKAVMANVISVDATGTGYVRAAAYDPTMSSAGATVLNFNNGLVSSNAIPLTMCDTTTTVCDWDVDLWIPANATSNIVIDIVGYYS
jgi:hypothetical protein